MNSKLPNLLLLSSQWLKTARSNPQPAARSGGFVAILVILATIGTARIVSARQLPPPHSAGFVPIKLLHFAPAGNARMTTSIAVGNDGNVWIGTESGGVWHCVIQSGLIGRVPIILKNVSRKGLPLPANVYASAVDHANRIWLGSLRHGICVISGNRARLYSPISGLGPDRRSVNGPLGNRIFAVAVSPIDGSVWIGTDCGIARYKPETRQWIYYTAADGLASDAISSLAFAPDGTVFVGLASAGLSIGSPRDHYHSWRHVGGPLHIPLTPSGRGLPCPYVNAIVIAAADSPNGGGDHAYRVYVGTDDGLAIGTQNGRRWMYVRGSNYILKDKYMYPPPLKSRPPPPQTLMSSDYVTALGVEPDGTIWIGHRTTGVDILTPAAGASAVAAPGVFTPLKALNGHFISAIAVVPHRGTLVGTYGSGVYWFKSSPGPLSTVIHDATGHYRPRAALPKPAPLPKPASAPTATQLVRMMQTMKAGFGAPPTAAVLGCDWSTQGDWLGHYGVNFARLCCGTTEFSDAQEQFFGGKGRCEIVREESPYPQFFNQGDWACYLAWPNSTLRSTLYFPDARMRVEGEWNDAGGRYPRLTDGPDMWLDVRIPSGIYALSFYYHNKDGQRGMNKIRDYVAMVYPGAKNPTYALQHEKPLAVARIYQFFGGEYCRFLLKGPGDYQVRLKRNYGFWMPVQGMFLDRLSRRHPGTDYDHLDGLPVHNYRPPNIVPTAKIKASAAWRLWRLTRQSGAWGPADLKIRRQVRIAAYRYAVAHHFPKLLLRRWRWELHLWNHNDSLRFDSLMRKLNNR